MAKERKSALELASIVRDHLAEPKFRIGIFFNKVHGWRAKVYSAENDRIPQQTRVDAAVHELRERYDLEQ